jgi:A/G-specific adenine glycosylase
VRRVLARHAGVAGDLWPIAEARLAKRDIGAYTQGLMDLGARVCKSREPQCVRCPVARDCVAKREGRWHELPVAKKAAPRPTRRTAMVVLLDRGEVFLEKRPATGVWGGLWSLPECAVDTPIADAVRGWGFAPRDIVALDPFRHTFTHFTLEIAPWQVHVRATPHAKRAGIWMPLADVAGAALPSPVKKLLSRSASAGGGNGAAPRAAASRRSARGASASRRS